ncbi:MAG: hypothetical protein ACSLE1_01980 [Sphingobium sp.]
MSRTLAKVAMIAGAVALVATGVGAAAGAGLFTASTAAGAASAAAISATATSIATYASLAAAVASLGATVTAKKPVAKGNVNQVTIATDAPAPYIIGRTYSGGMLRHDTGYGATLKKVKNPYRGMVIEYSVAGPMESLEGVFTDYANVGLSGGAATGYYSGYLYADHRVGALPDTALTPHFAGMPNWTSAHKLSGKAAILWNLKFDKDAKRFASGVPVLGAIWKGVKCYDPRLDSTYPGGSGSHRVDNYLTWTWSENPGLHALKYALGSHANGKKVFGVGLPIDGIMVEHFVTLANVCDANGWTVGGVIYEPGDRWANLKDILQAGGAEPLFIGGKLGLRINAPGVAIDTLSAADLADDDAEVTGMQTWRDRRNGIVPKYRSETNKWDYVQSALVTVPAFVTADGEEKNEERQFNLVQDKDQAAQLAGYELYNGRERFPITLVCKPRMRKYGPGDMLTLALPDHDLVGVDAVIVDRSIDPGRMTVSLTLMEETSAKHAVVLALNGTAPPAPILSTGEDRDDVAASIDDQTPDALLIQASYPVNLTVSSNNVGGTATITISDHIRRYADKDVAITGADLTGLDQSTAYWIYYDDDTRSNTAPIFEATEVAEDAYLSVANPARHLVYSITT